MSRKKSPSEVSTKVVRINVDDYLALTALADDQQQTIATILHKVLTFSLHAQDKEPPAPIEQLYFKAVPVEPVFRETTPVALRARPQATIATNGSKPVAFRIRPKGVSHD